VKEREREREREREKDKRKKKNCKLNGLCCYTFHRNLNLPVGREM
jgi:hypothetical protein